MSKIYLLSPWCEESPREYDEESTSYDISLQYIKFYLIDSGYNVELINCAKYDKDLNEVIDKLKNDRKPIIGVTAYTRERFQAYNLIRRIRSEIPDSLIVVGGRHFGSLVEETFRELPEVDIVVRGEGEITFREICEAAINNANYAAILGISYKAGNEIIHNPDRPLEVDLDKFRCYDLNNIQEYTYITHTKVDKKNLYFYVYATRGCPFNCVYCCLSTRKVRYRSIDSIIAEIEAKIAAVGIRRVLFGDSSLTISNKFVTELCEKIIEKDLKIRWHCYSRVNIDTNILKLMKKAGMVSAAVGLESGSPKVLKSIKKKIKLEQVETYCKEAHKLGIKLFVFCMISLPDETLEDVDMTLSFVKTLSKYIYHVGMQNTRIFPDAGLYEIAIERNILPIDFNWFADYERDDKVHVTHTVYRTLPFYLEHLTLEDIKKKQEEFDDNWNRDFASFDTLRSVIKKNLRKEALKNMTLTLFKRKSINGFELFKDAFHNRQKKDIFSPDPFY